MKTSYINPTTLALISVNKQSREEVASIFNSQNKFHFNTMSLLVPFVKDGTIETRKYIQQVL